MLVPALEALTAAGMAGSYVDPVFNWLPYHLTSSSLTLELQVFCLPSGTCVQFAVVYFSDKSGRPIEQELTVATGCSTFSVSFVAMCLVWRNVCSSDLFIFKIVLLGFVIGFRNLFIWLL